MNHLECEDESPAYLDAVNPALLAGTAFRQERRSMLPRDSKQLTQGEAHYQ